MDGDKFAALVLYVMLPIALVIFLFLEWSR
jgi:hypothetical protein